MEPTFGVRTPTPRLIDIKPPKLPSERPENGQVQTTTGADYNNMTINPTLSSHRRTSRHNIDAVKSVPEMGRFSSLDNAPDISTKSYRSGSRSHATLNFPARTERESMKELADFLMSYDPPSHKFLPVDPPGSKKKFGIFSKRNKKYGQLNEFVQLPDTAISAKTRNGVQYIAISIPIQYDYLGKLTKSDSLNNFESASTKRPPSGWTETDPTTVNGPVYKRHDRTIDSHSDTFLTDYQRPRPMRNTWGPGVTLKTESLKSDSRLVLSKSDYFAHYRPPGNIPRAQTQIGRSNMPSFNQHGAQRTYSTGSIDNSYMCTNGRERQLKVVNRTPSPQYKSAYRNYKISKSRSTIQGVSTAGGITKSLKSTPESFTSSPTATVFGTAETIDIQGFRVGTPVPALSPQEQPEPLSKTRPLSSTTNTVRSPPPSPRLSGVNTIINRPQPVTNNRHLEEMARQNRRDQVRARKERDLAEVRAKTNRDKHSDLRAETYSPSVNVPGSWPEESIGYFKRVTFPKEAQQARSASAQRMYRDGTHLTPALIDEVNDQSLGKLVQPKSLKLQSRNASNIITFSPIMVVADLPPLLDDVPHQPASDYGFPRPVRSTNSLGKPAYLSGTAQTHRTKSESNLLRRPRLRSTPAHVKQSSFDFQFQEHEKQGGKQENDLDLRMRSIERDTEEFLRTLDGFTHGLSDVDPLLGSRHESPDFTHQSPESSRRQNLVPMSEIDMVDSVMRELQMLAPRISHETLGGRTDSDIEEDRISL